MEFLHVHQGHTFSKYDISRIIESNHGAYTFLKSMVSVLPVLNLILTSPCRILRKLRQAEKVGEELRDSSSRGFSSARMTLAKMRAKAREIPRNFILSFGR